MSEPRRHHYVPKFYLAGFTPSGNVDDKLWVFDLRSERPRQQKPENVALQRDFYRIEVDGQEPFAVERDLSQHEGNSASVLAEVIASRALPSGEDLRALMSFIAVMAVRIPALRDTFRQAFNAMTRQMMENTVASAERWEASMVQLKQTDKWKQFVTTMKAEGRIEDESDLPDYEAMKRFVDEERYEFGVNRELKIAMTLPQADHLVGLLMRRRWWLVRIPSGEGELITSDRPVSLCYYGPPTSPFPPGFAVPGTEVRIPLSKNLLLAGRFEGEGGVGTGNERVAAIANHQTALWASSCVYSPTQDFLCADDALDIQSGAELFRTRVSPFARPDAPNT